MNKQLNISFTLFLLFVFIIGCGKKPEQQNTTSGDQKQEQPQTDPKQISQNNQNTGTDKKSNELGLQQGLPGDYPKDVPQPKDSKVLGSLNTSEGMVVTFESSSKPRDILAQFASDIEKSGFKKDGEEQMSDNGGTASWKKEKRDVNIMLAWDKEKNICSVVVTYK